MTRFAACLAFVGLLFAGCASGPPHASPFPASTSAAPPVASSRHGTISSAESCVELYSLEKLRERTYAFDGTVLGVTPGPPASGDTAPGPDRVTFRVNRWFKGGSGATTVRFAEAFGGYTSAGGTPHSVGDHLLVTGDEDFIWTCGFTQAYSEAVARQWATALDP